MDNFKINYKIKTKVPSAGYVWKLNDIHITRTIPEYEIFLLVKGHLSILQNNQVYNLKEGDVFISNANIKYGGIKKENCSFYFFHLAMDGYITKADQDITIPQKMHFDDYDDLILIINFIIKYHRDENATELVLSFLNSFFSLLEHKYINNQNNKKNLKLGKIVEYLIFTPHLAELNSSKAIAQKYGYNERYLSALFKKEIGITLNEFLIKVKIDKSRRMLLESDKEVKEIATLLNYRVDYFIRFFKKHVGVSPSKFRKTLYVQSDDLIEDAKRIFLSQN